MKGGILFVIAFIFAWLMLPAPESPVSQVSPLQPKFPPGIVASTSAPDAPRPTTPTRLVIPELGLDADIAPSPPDKTPETAVGWWDAPERGDVVLWGHNYGVFSPLASIQVGQSIALQYADRVTWHSVIGTEIRPANGNIPDAVAGQIILITCLPFPAGSAERLIIYAR